MNLIKSVLGSSPTYYMSIYKAPQGILDVLETLRCRFLSGGTYEKRKIHWVDWSKVVANKKDRGLGVGTLKAQNITLLTKWWCRLKNEADCLWSKVIVSIHTLNQKPTNYLVSKRVVGVWSNISKAINNLNTQNIDPNCCFRWYLVSILNFSSGKIPGVVRTHSRIGSHFYNN